MSQIERFAALLLVMPSFALALSSIAAPAYLRVLRGGGSGESPPDALLVARAKEGDRTAANELLGRHIGSVLARARRLMGPSADAEDVVQDAFFEALRDLPRLDDPERFGAWVNKIALHQMHRRFRRRKLLRALGMAPSADDQGLAQLVADHCDPSVRAQLAELDGVLAAFPTRDRLAWMLRHVEGLQLDEVAGQLEVSLATVKRSIARVQAVVSQRFGSDWIEEEAP